MLHVKTKRICKIVDKHFQQDLLNTEIDVYTVDAHVYVPKTIRSVWKKLTKVNVH